MLIFKRLCVIGAIAAFLGVLAAGLQSAAAEPQIRGAAREPHPARLGGLGYLSVAAPVLSASAGDLPADLTTPGKPRPEGKPFWEGKKRNLIILTLDTTRADHISAYGVHPDLTPHIDKLAATGTLFLNGMSQTNQTNPSHMTVMTGLMGIEHGILDNEQQIERDVDMLPAAFKRAGYRTAGFPSSSHVSAWLGWKGFDHIYDVAPDPKTYLSAEEVTDRALEWLGKNETEPFFIWVHYWDPHAPYAPPKNLLSKYYQGNPKAPGKEEIRKHPSIQKSKWLTGVTDLEYPMALYKAEVNYTDLHIGRLLKYLDEKGLAETTGIVLVGDHGENLGEHEMYFNHYFTFEPSLRVPFIMRMPGLKPGVKVSERVTQLDIAPTIAELYGIEFKNPLRGVSLASAMKGEKDAALSSRQVFVHEHGNNRQIVIRDGDIKVIYSITPFKTHPPLHVEAGEVWVYDLSRDPTESKNLAEIRSDLVEKYRPYVQKWFDLKGTGSMSEDEDARPNLTPAQKKALEGLGYMDDPDEEEDEAPVKGKGKAPAKKGAEDPDDPDEGEPKPSDAKKKPKKDE